MFREDELRELKERKKGWAKGLAETLRQTPERLPRFSTVSDLEIKDLYTPDDIRDINYSRDIGFPGASPFTRGFSLPCIEEDSGPCECSRVWGGGGNNKRFHYLLSHGETGLSVAFHYPTLMGYDSDSPMSKGEIGKCGVAIDTLKDMEILFEESRWTK